MSRFSRINAIWRKELSDTLRDRRTLVAMVVVPMVLYPGLILASLLALEFQTHQLTRATYRVAVADEPARRWLRRLIDTDPTRRPPELAAQGSADASGPHASGTTAPSAPPPAGRPSLNVRESPPEYEIVVVGDVAAAVVAGDMHVGIVLSGGLPTAEDDAAVVVDLVLKERDIRSEVAAAGIEAILQRATARLVADRLARLGIRPQVIQPIAVVARDVATQEERDGWLAGLIIPPILIILTITGTVYPAIDLTAGERERGTLETLMVAPVPPIDLITGKFIVVTLIGLLSAALNLLAFGGTMYLGGIGKLLTTSWNLTLPLGALPWIAAALAPLAIMFGAILLAVASFARSFKEAQNYVMPVIMAAMMPAMISVIPGTRLEGPLLIMPVANIVLMTRELFVGRFEVEWIIWVTLSTGLYATAAVAVAARLFGQEAVLFADNASIRALFRRRFFRPRWTPTASQSLLTLAIAYPLNFFIQNALGQTAGVRGTVLFLYAVALWMILLFVVVPVIVALYARVNVAGALALRAPGGRGWAAGLCLGASTWILAKAWLVLQQHFLPMNPEVLQQLMSDLEFLNRTDLLTQIALLALVPAICEELFFRGFVLSGARAGAGAVGGVILVALAFALFHQSVYRIIPTAVLGLLFGVLVLRFGSIWPAIVAHAMHNGLTATSEGIGAFKDWLGWQTLADPGSLPMTLPGPIWIAAAGAVALAGVALCFMQPAARDQGAQERAIGAVM
ncbi:MAG: hypothetical protein CHACPFDD_01887 [Phycisphaerae bacterium]|nr:hypothetical protein [Phycisphaerae bacterium]